MKKLGLRSGDLLREKRMLFACRALFAELTVKARYTAVMNEGFVGAGKGQ